MKKLEGYWLTLIAITLFNTLLGERLAITELVAVIVAFTVSYKGFSVIDHFMELKHGNIFLRRMMKTYFIIFPSLIILSVFF